MVACVLGEGRWATVGVVLGAEECSGTSERERAVPMTRRCPLPPIWTLGYKLSNLSLPPLPQGGQKAGCGGPMGCGGRRGFVCGALRLRRPAPRSEVSEASGGSHMGTVEQFRMSGYVRNACSVGPYPLMCAEDTQGEPP